MAAVTTASRISPGVAEGIECENSSENGYRQLDFAASSEIWVSFYYSEVSSTANSRRFGFRICSDGSVLFQWGGSSINNNNLYMQYWNGASYTNMTSAPFPVNSLSHILIHIKMDDTVGIIEYFVNGVLIASFSGDTITTGITTLNQLKIGLTDAGGLSSGMCYSAIMVADHDISNLMYLQRAVNGAGAETAWTGDYTSVDETGVSDADIIYSANNGDVETFTKAAQSSLYNTYNIYGVGVSARAKRGTSGPQNLQLVARSGSTNGFSANKALDLAWTTEQELFDENPDTAAPWTFAEADSAQVGVKAIT